MTTLPTLYELTEQYRRLLDIAAAEPDAFETALSDLQGEIVDKAAGCCAVIRQLEAEAEMYAGEIARLNAHAKARQNAATHLKAYLKANMEAAGMDAIKAGLFSARIQKSPPSCTILDEEAVPSGYKVLVPEHWEMAADGRRRIIAAWKEGVAVPGAEVSQGGHLVIR